VARLDVAYLQLQGKGSLRPLRVSQIEPVRIIVEEELEAAWMAARLRPRRRSMTPSIVATRLCRRRSRRNC
jgi:hypothetical protein